MDAMDLKAKIALDSSEYDTGIDNASNKFSGFGSTLKSGAKTIGKIGVTAFAALSTAVVGTGTAIISSANATAQYADNIDKMSQKMGISAESFQEWDFIMQHCGTSIESLKPSMKTLANAAETNSDAFEKLGISQEEIANMSQEELFGATISALQNVEDETERTYLAGKLLGRGATELGPLLNMTAEETDLMRQQVHDLGGVMSDEAVKAGASYQDSLQNLKTVLGGLKNNLMGEFLPAITSVMDGLTALFSGDDSGIGKIKEGIESFANNLNERLPSVIQTISGIAGSLIEALPSLFNTIAQQLPSIIEQGLPVLINAVVGLADAIVDALPGIMTSIEANIDVISNGLTKILSAVGQIIMKLLPSLLPTMIKVAVKLIKELSNGFSKNSKEIIKTIVDLVNLIVKELTNPDTLMTILDCGLQIVVALAEGIIDNIPYIAETILELIGNIIVFLAEAIPEIITKVGEFGAKIITDVLPGLILNASEKLSELIGEIIEAIGGWISDIEDKALEVFKGIGTGIKNAWEFITEKLGELISDILEAIGGWWQDLVDKAKDVFAAIGDGIKSAWETISTKVEEFGELVWGGIEDAFSGMWEYGKELGNKIWEGIKSTWQKLKDALNPKNWGAGYDNIMSDVFVQMGYSEETANEAARILEEQGEDAASAYLEGQEKGFDINSPSKKMAYIGRMVMKGFSKGIEDQSDDSFRTIDSVFTDGMSDIGVTPSVSVNGRMTDTDAKLQQVIDLLATNGDNGGGNTFPIIVGGREIDEVYIDSKNRITTRSGGRVYV